MTNPVIDAYLKHADERKGQGIPPRALDPEQTREVAQAPPEAAQGPGGVPARAAARPRLAGRRPGRRGEGGLPGGAGDGQEEVAAHLQEGRRVHARNDGRRLQRPSARRGAQGEGARRRRRAKRSPVSPTSYDAFDEVVALAKAKNLAAKKVLESWAEAEWFTSRAGVPDQVKVKVFKVDGEINTDDFSPAGDASTRPDIPLHALAMGKTRFPGGLKTIAEFRAQGPRSPSSATWSARAPRASPPSTRSSGTSARTSRHVPNKRRGGIVIGGVIAPIFFNTAEDSGALPIKTDVSRLKTGDVVIIDFKKGEIRAESGEVLSTFELKPENLGRRVPGRRAHPAHHRPRPDRQGPQGPEKGPTEVFVVKKNPQPKKGQGYSWRRRWWAGPAACRACSPAGTSSRR